MLALIQIPLLTEMVIILGLSSVLLIVLQRWKVPSILGFLLTGILIGPNVLGWVNAVHEVELLAEIGVILLLFIIGVEFSLKSLAAIKKTVIIGGGIQVFGTALFTAILAYFWGLPVANAVFLGFLISLSSTAIVLRLLQQKNEIGSTHGRMAVGILIFQDLIVVPMMLLTPIIAGKSDNPLEALGVLGLKVAALIGLMILAARFVVPRILEAVAKAKSRELFMIATLALCFSAAWVTASVGLSLALGAFFAGLIISESEYSHQATANILPFREIFISFFFVSIGMLLDVQYFFLNLHWILLFSIGVIILKSSIVLIAGKVLKLELKSSLLSALALFQVGEFAFVLSVSGLQNDILSQNVYQMFLAVSILSMAITPIVLMRNHKIAKFILKMGVSKRVLKRFNSIESRKKQHAIVTDVQQLSDHIVIIGYGINGQNVACAAKQAGIPFLVIEFDPRLYQKVKDDGGIGLFGDACEPHILDHAHLEKARVVVIAISDPVATKRVVTEVRHHSQLVHLIVRTRMVNEVEELNALGADEVIPEEFETSVEIFARVLHQYLVPSDEIEGFIRHIRSMNYDMLRSVRANDSRAVGKLLDLPDVELATLKVQQEANEIVGKTLAQVNLPQRFGVSVLAVRRAGKYITKLDPNHTIEIDDTMYLFGRPKGVAELNKWFKFNKESHIASV